MALVAVLVCLAAPGCGQFMGDCSGGVYTNGGCVNTQIAVHWTNAKATPPQRDGSTTGRCCKAG
jgi:hypothetical protein